MLLAFNNLADGATLSGGSWQAALPQSNLKDRRLSVRSRSTSTGATIIADLGSAQSISAVALAGHNLTVNATIQVQASSASDFATVLYDSGALNVWPGLTLSDKIENYPGLAYVSGSSDLALARYWKILISDVYNSAGYVEFGRLYIGTGWKPEFPPSFNWGIQYEDPSQIEESIGGCEFYDPRPKFRVFRFSLDYLSEIEARNLVLGLQRDHGITGELLLIWDETNRNVKTSFLGRLRSLNPIENPDPVRYTSAFEVKEIVA